MKNSRLWVVDTSRFFDIIKATLRGSEGKREDGWRREGMNGMTDESRNGWTQKGTRRRGGHVTVHLMAQV